MSNPFSGLTELNINQIAKYLRFFRQKKDSLLRTINNEFNDMKDDKLNDEMYTKEDTVEFANFMQASVRGHVGQEVASLINMSALAVSQLLESAQAKSCDIALDTSLVENHLLIEAIEKLNLDSLPKSSMRIGELVSLKDEAKAQKDEIERLELNNQTLQNEIKSLRKILRDTVSDSKSSGDNNSERCRRLENQLEEVKEESNKRISETAQFMQMKKLMQSQAVKLKDLKNRLNRYEPDDAEKEDD